MAESLRILILEDNPADAELIQFELQEAGLTFTAKVVMTESDFLRDHREFQANLILSDYDLPQYNGALALGETRRRCPDTPFILVTGALSEDHAIEIFTRGAKDYVLKTRLHQRLVPAVRRALAEAEEQRARKQAEDELREAHRTLEKRIKIRTAELEAEVSERIRAEQTLRKSEERRRAILQTAMDGFWLLDMQGHLLEVNETYCRMSGYSEQELLIMSIHDLESAETTDDTAAHIQKVMARGEDRFESKHRRKNGTIFNVEVSVQYRPSEGGRFVAFLRDITESK
jgi:PAS domain S-box-containing protein